MRYVIFIGLLLCLSAPARAEMCVVVDEGGQVVLSADPGNAEQMESNVQALQIKPSAYNVLCGPAAKTAYQAWEDAEKDQNPR